MPYTLDKPKLVRDTSVLRTTIPGWGVDLDRLNRPGVPKERLAPGTTGAHWDFPERQVPRYEREKSTEHAFLTPVFGTVCPPKGLSGAIRRYAYRSFSEGRATHWLLLMLADRIDVVESMVVDAVRGRPDNLVAEYGLKAEIERHGWRSRVGRHRADVMRQPLELVLVAGAAAATVMALRRLSSRRSRGSRLFA